LREYAGAASDGGGEVKNNGWWRWRRLGQMVVRARAVAIEATAEE
jgi:hypothetical protein